MLDALRRAAQHVRQTGVQASLRRARFRAEGLRRHADYRHWVRAFDSPTMKDLDVLRQGRPGVPEVPFSVLLRVGTDQHVAFQRTVASLRAQTHTAWALELQDVPNDQTTAPVLDQLLGLGLGAHRLPHDPEFVVLLEAGDQLAPYALSLTAAAVDRSGPDIVYADCDWIAGGERRVAPWFKPDFNLELLFELNYLSGFLAVRRTVLDAVPDAQSRGSDSHDAVLRLVEATSRDRVLHLPHVLCHRLAPPGAAAGALLEPALAPAPEEGAVRAHLRRAGVPADVESVGSPYPRLRVRWKLPASPPAVTVVIPTRDGVELLRRCVDGLLHRTSYPDLQIIVADNDSTDPASLSYLDELRDHPSVQVMAAPGPFNYSAINNRAVELVRTPLLLLLNNDIDVIHHDWLTEMVALACWDDVGVVGAKLLYADETVQHAGVVLGLRPSPGIPGVAGHPLKLAGRTEPGYFGRLLHTQEVSAVTGACLLTHTDLWGDLGGLDEEHLPVAFNDIDYCLRVRADGRRVVWTPLAELYHLESVSRGEDNEGSNAERFQRECTWMHGRWNGLLDLDPFYSPNLSLDRTDLTLSYPPRTQRPWSGR